MKLPDKRIVDLNTVDNVKDGDYLVVGSENDTYKATVETLKSAILPTLMRKKIRHNGIYRPEYEGVYGYGTVTVIMEGGGSILDTLLVTENGTYAPTGEAEGFSEVRVEIPPAPREVLHVSTNGTYTPSEGIYGFSMVRVAVPPETAEIASVAETKQYLGIN